MIRDKVIAGNVVTKIGFFNSVEANFRVSLAYGWIRCFLQRRAEDLRQAIIATSELPRMHVPRRYLNQ
jgi:hypothetical protein